MIGDFGRMEIQSRTCPRKSKLDANREITDSVAADPTNPNLQCLQLPQRFYCHFGQGLKNHTIGYILHNLGKKKLTTCIQDFFSEKEEFDCLVNDTYAVIPAHAVTSIKQSPVLKGHLILILSQKILFELNIFQKVICLIRPLCLCPKGDL